MLKINKSKQKINSVIRIYTVKEGKFKVIYVPAFDLTAYGKNDNEAKEMLREVLEDYFGSLIELKLDQIRSHLVKFGWSVGIFRKQFENTKKLGKKGVLRHLKLPQDTLVEESMLKVA